MNISALIAAAYKGHIEIVQLLLESNKVDVNQKTTEVYIDIYGVRII